MKSVTGRLILVGAFLASALLAQNQNSVLTGRVTDPSGSGVPNAAIRVTEHATGAARDGRSIEDGTYRFDLLPPASTHSR